MESLTVNKAIEIMGKRDYTNTSHIQTRDEITAVNFVKKLSDDITIYAKVELKSQTVVLSFSELKYLCELQCGHFDINHPEFAKFESTMLIYAAKCMDVDVFQVLALLPLKNESSKGGATKNMKKDIKTRKREFWDEIVSIGKTKGYPKDSCLKFYEYWTQMNTGGVKMLFEITKAKKGVFDVARRLVTWMKNDKEWEFQKKSFVDKKIEKQNEETHVSKTINKEDVF